MTTEGPRDFIDQLEQAEARIAELRQALDRRIDGMSGEALIALGLTKRAANLYDGALAIADISPAGAMVVLRSLTELAILMRWLEVDPALRQRLWLAEDDRLRIANAERWPELRRRRGLEAPRPSSRGDSRDEPRDRSGETGRSRRPAAETERQIEVAAPFD